VSEDAPIGSDDRALDDAALEALAASVAAPPPPELRARVLGAVAREAALARGMRRWRRAGAAALAAAAALAGVLVWDARQDRRRSEATLASLAELEERRAGLAERIEAQQRELLVLSESLATQAELMQILATPRLVTASLAPQAGRAGSARVLVDPASGEAALVVAGLAPLAAGQVYELWALRGPAPPEPAGLFAAPAAAATVRLPRVPDAAAVTAFAVSIEPEGGSPRPTGPIVLVGEVGT
jgi:anti-sigma-K factor RskA